MWVTCIERPPATTRLAFPCAIDSCAAALACALKRAKPAFMHQKQSAKALGPSHCAPSAICGFRREDLHPVGGAKRKDRSPYITVTVPSGTVIGRIQSSRDRE